MGVNVDMIGLVVARGAAIRWFVLAAVLGCLTAAVAKYALGSVYPWWRLAMLVDGLLYVPVVRRPSVPAGRRLHARSEARGSRELLAKNREDR